MAIVKACAVYDKKAEAFQPPFFVPALGVATRDFVDAFSNKENAMSRHREDFDLYELGDFDTSSADFKCLVPVRLMFKGSDIGD